MRHYVEVKNGELVRTTLGDHLYYNRKDCFRCLSDGLYRAKTVRGSRHSRGGFAIGAMCGSASEEAARLQRLQDKRAFVATTGLPGISGYQQRADAASGRLHNLRSETARLIDWLNGKWERA